MRRLGRGYAPRVSPALPSWLRPPWTRTIDVLVALAVFVLVVPATIAGAVETDEVLEAALISLAAVLVLVWRRRWPFLVLAGDHGRLCPRSRSTARSGSR